jgi:curli biogenesis system outer membrane secretion channel CsgG
VNKRAWWYLLFLLLIATACGCTSARHRSEADGSISSGPSMADVQAEPYDGPKARIAVSRFTDRTGKGWWSGQIGDGMADMLCTALFNTNRFVVLERQRLQEVLAEQDLGASGRTSQETAPEVGAIEGAELLVTGAVSEFEPGSAGIYGTIGNLARFGGKWGGLAGSILGSIRKSHVGIDLRVVDTRTSRIVAATSVKGEAIDFDLAGMVVGSHVGGGLGGYSNTPVEKAVRVALGEAVKFVVDRTPSDYYHVGEEGNASPPPLNRQRRLRLPPQQNRNRKATCRTNHKA